MNKEVSIMLYRVESDTNIKEDVTSNYIEALGWCISSMTHYTTKELQNLHKNGAWYVIHSYDGLVEEDIWREFLDSNIGDENTVTDLNRIMSDEFTDYKFAFCFKELTKYQINNFSNIALLYYELRKSNVLERQAIITKALDYECWILDRDSTWYGDSIPNEWIKQLTSTIYNCPNDMQLFFNEYEDVIEQINQANEDYWNEH